MSGAAGNPGGAPPVVRNDWSAVPVPRLGRWRPTLPVSVVIPAYRCQHSLDLTLAALAVQTYPASLLEVVVVDDGSAPPLELPELRPEHCRLVRVPDHAPGWGRANALHLGVAHSDGDVIHWLDADMVAYPEHVEAQARWHHQVRYAVTLGYKRFVDVAPGAPGWPTAADVAAAGRAGTSDRLFPGRESARHDHVEEIIDGSDRLRAGDHLIFMAHVGATAALRRELYRASGGLDTALRLGEDTEFGYRLAQAGALFVPEPQARSWHLGATHMMRHEDDLRRYNRPFLADRMPQPRWLRRVGGSTWAVPLVTVVVEVAGQPLERVRAAVDAILASDEPDLRVCLVGPWRELSGDRVPVLADPQREPRLIAATYRSDPRVRLAERAPDSAFPSPYLLRVPVTCALAPWTVRRLVDHADQQRLGVLRVAPWSGPPVTLWRTAALGRAGWLGGAEVADPALGDPALGDLALGDLALGDLVARTYGAGTVTADAAGVVDLAAVPAARLADGVGAIVAGTRRPAPWLPSSVEVAGVRSLARAAWVVARLGARRVWARIRH